MKPLHPARRGAIAALVVTVATLSNAALARTIRVDVGSTNYDSNGQAWQASETPLGGAAFLAGSLPFAINFGTGATSSFCLFGNGSVGFSSNCGAVPPNALLTPLLANWTVNPTASRIFESGSVTFTSGHLAREAPFPADPNDAPLAVRFHWNDLTCDTCGNFTYSFQAILVDMGNGDFDLELNYSDIPAGVGVAGFSLGANTFSFSGPFLSSQDYDFRFRGGQLVGGNAVPEPAAAWLLLVAAAAWGIARRRAA
jgi:hypothetical protein